MTFRGWTYSLEAYAIALESAGLVLERLREPRPTGSWPWPAKRAPGPHVPLHEGKEAKEAHALTGSQTPLAPEFRWTWPSERVAIVAGPGPVSGTAVHLRLSPDTGVSRADRWKKES